MSGHTRVIRLYDRAHLRSTVNGALFIWNPAKKISSEVCLTTELVLFAKARVRGYDFLHSGRLCSHFPVDITELDLKWWGLRGFGAVSSMQSQSRGPKSFNAMDAHHYDYHSLGVTEARTRRPAKGWLNSAGPTRKQSGACLRPCLILLISLSLEEGCFVQGPISHKGRLISRLNISKFYSCAFILKPQVLWS